MTTLLAVICLILAELMLAFVIWAETVMSWVRRVRSRLRSITGRGRAA